MGTIDYSSLISEISGKEVERPNKATAGTLSGHAAGEPFEKTVYGMLKEKYPNNIYKQYEYLNDLYLKNPKVITVEERNALFQSPTVLFLLSRGDKATREWSPMNLFEEKQNDTADIIFHSDGYFDLIDVKTRNVSKEAQAPNIISALKLAKACAYMIDNKDFNVFGIHYIEVDWKENDGKLLCTKACYADLFKENPDSLYINWAAAMQIQFHVSNLKQDCNLTTEAWAHQYIKTFVKSAKNRCDKMMREYVMPFLQYLTEAEQSELFSSANNA